jgi:hypothetical protein
MTTKTATLMTEAAPTNEGNQSSQGEATATEAGTAPVTTEAKPEQQEAKTEEVKVEVKVEGAPEKYDFKAPDGKAFDADVLGKFSEVAKDLNMTQANAQKMLDTIAPALAEKMANAQASAKAEWAASSKADKEFGGDKLLENLAVAEKSLEQLGTPELRKLLLDTGLSHHPEVIRMLFKAGKAISEDGYVGAGRSDKQIDPAKILFPNQN